MQSPIAYILKQTEFYNITVAFTEKTLMQHRLSGHNYRNNDQVFITATVLGTTTGHPAMMYFEQLEQDTQLQRTVS